MKKVDDGYGIPPYIHELASTYDYSPIAMYGSGRRIHASAKKELLGGVGLFLAGEVLHKVSSSRENTISSNIGRLLMGVGTAAAITGAYRLSLATILQEGAELLVTANEYDTKTTSR